MTKRFLDELNPKQLEAVLYDEGPLAIIAGAGTGKTKTITHKIAHIIKTTDIKPWEVLAVTFTNKAANEMKERISKLVGDDIGKRINTFTYHALAARILREDISLYGFSSRFSILDPIDQRQILRGGYKKYDLSVRTIPFKTVIQYISNAKNENMSPSELREVAEKDIDKALANLYEYYINVTKKTNSLDFDDLLIYAEKLLMNHNDVAKKWINRFRYVLVDEFQDTSHTQYNIINIIAKKSHFTVVGDPDQTIYTWRHADVNLILDFKKNHKNAKVILLEENYRSTKNILSAANRLINFNKNRIPKDLFTSQKEGDVVHYSHQFSEDSEARWVVSQVMEIIEEGKYKYRDIAILYRSNYLSYALEKAFIGKGISYLIMGGVKFYQREEVKDVVAFLKVIGKSDGIALERIINIPSRKIGPTSRGQIFSYLSSRGGASFDNLSTHFAKLPIKKLPKQSLANFINLIRKYKAALGSNLVSEVIEKFLIEVNYMSKWASFENQARQENVNEFVWSIKRWEKNNPGKGIDDFLEDISLYTEKDSTPLTDDYVTMMTAHSSKGLEFPIVFVYELSEMVFPAKRSLQERGNDALEEERRLAYVSITRAMKKLYISSSRGYAADYESQKTPSRFVKELGIDPQSYSAMYIAPKNFEDNYTTNDLVEGDGVNHEKFGDGVIVSIENEIATIAFRAPFGIKTLMKNHKSLRKVNK